MTREERLGAQGRKRASETGLRFGYTTLMIKITIIYIDR